MKFGEVLRRLRTNAGMTQLELAGVLGCSESTVGMYERGQREPAFEMLEKIAKHFGVGMDVLLGKENEYSSESDVSVHLNQTESRLVEEFRSLTEQDQEYLLRTLEILLRGYF